MKYTQISIVVYLNDIEELTFLTESSKISAVTKNNSTHPSFIE